MPHDGPRLHDVDVVANPECSVESRGLQKHRKKKEAPKAQARNLNKRDIPPRPHRLFKTLGSWKLWAIARNHQHLDFQIDGSPVDGDQVRVNLERVVSSTEEAYLKPERKKCHLEVAPNESYYDISFLAVVVEQHRYPQWLSWAQTIEGLKIFRQFMTCGY